MVAKWIHDDGSALQVFLKNFHFTRSLTILLISMDDYFNQDQLKSEANSIFPQSQLLSPKEWCWPSMFVNASQQSS